MKAWAALCVMVALVQTFAACAAEDPVFDVKALTSTPLNAKVLKSSEKDGIVTEEVMFHSHMDGDKSVDIFAFFSYPKGAKNLPAFVWNQGGLGQASTYWTEFGAKRGYATLCIDFPMPGYRSTGGYNIVSGVVLTDDPRKAPIYHGAVALLKAVSYLESRPEVDKNRIGMAGSSWGGFYTTLMAGVDPRLKAAACFFGCGALQLGNTWWDAGGRGASTDAAYRERWRTTLDPALRLPNRDIPIAWFTGTNDTFYWMPALMGSYDAARGPKHISLLPNWNHGLTPTLDEQVFTWLDVHLKGAPAFNTVSRLKVVPFEQAGEVRHVVAWTFDGPRPVKSAELILSPGGAGNWVSRFWMTRSTAIVGKECSAIVPDMGMQCYVSGTVIDNQGFRYSTPLVPLDADKYGSLDVSAKLDYDGCSPWGGFEKDQVFYLVAQAFMNPTVSNDAKEGQQSAVFKAGANRMHPLLFTAGVPHRFTCWMKADKPADVAVQLNGNFDGQQKNEDKTFNVVAAWTQVSMDYTPPKALSAGLSAIMTVPKDVTVLVDCVSFRPLPAAK